MEQETRKFAISEAIKLISGDDHIRGIANKRKAIFDLSEEIILWIKDGTAPQTK